MAIRRVRVGLGVLGVCAAVLVMVLVVQRLNLDSFSGDPDDIASVKTALPKLVRGDRTAGTLPDDPSKFTAAVLHSEESASRRERAVRAVWVDERVDHQLKLWDGYVDEMLENKRRYGLDAEELFDDTRFDVTEWLGVRVDAGTAVVDVRAYDMYHFLGERGWVKGQALHHRFTLWRESVRSTRWYLVDEEQDVDGEYRVMRELTVGDGD